MDECAEGIDECVQICRDTAASYTCSCNSGYRLASDGRRCNGIRLGVILLILTFSDFIPFRKYL